LYALAIATYRHGIFVDEICGKIDGMLDSCGASARRTHNERPRLDANLVFEVLIADAWREQTGVRALY
jgi:hypothetical protein